MTTACCTNFSCPACRAADAFNALSASRQEELRAAADAYLQSSENAPPDGYRTALTALRAAEPIVTFEQDFQQRRLRDVLSTHEELAAEERRPRLTSAQLAEWRAPDGYAAGLKAMKEQR